MPFLVERLSCGTAGGSDARALCEDVLFHWWTCEHLGDSGGSTKGPLPGQWKEPNVLPPALSLPMAG